MLAEHDVCRSLCIRAVHQQQIWSTGGGQLLLNPTYVAIPCFPHQSNKVQTLHPYSMAGGWFTSLHVNDLPIGLIIAIRVGACQVPCLTLCPVTCDTGTSYQDSLQTILSSIRIVCKERSHGACEINAQLHSMFQTTFSSRS